MLGGLAADVGRGNFDFIAQPRFYIFADAGGGYLGFANWRADAEAGGIDAGVQFALVVWLGVMWRALNNVRVVSQS